MGQGARGIIAGHQVELGGLTDELDSEIRGDAGREVDEATDLVDGAPYPTADGFYDHVYAPTDGDGAGLGGAVSP